MTISSYTPIFLDESTLQKLSTASDEDLKITAYQLTIESLIVMNLLYLRAHPDAPRCGPIGPPWDGLKAAGVVVGRRQTECCCVVHSSDDQFVDLSEMLRGPRPALVDVEDVAAWRVAELRVAGDPLAHVEMHEDRHPGFEPPPGHPRHYRIVVVHGDGRKERFP